MSLRFSPLIHSKSLTLKYYAKKILYFLRQQKVQRRLKMFLELPAEQQSALEGGGKLFFFLNVRLEKSLLLNTHFCPV